MMELIYFLICFGASVIGAICGIGGGVIIKPVLDATNTMSVSAISFLSGCTVLAMSTYSVVRDKVSGKGQVKISLGLPLAIGAAIGGITGKKLLTFMVSGFEQSVVGRTQAICLLIVTAMAFVYTIFKSKIPGHHVKNPVVGVVLGLLLGIMSSFLGIGGGPINLIVLFFFYSLNTKEAASYSLFVIFLSQLASLILSFIERSIHLDSIWVLVLMVVGGILGGIIGRKINKSVPEKTVSMLFLCAMGLIMLINIYNIMRFSGLF